MLHVNIPCAVAKKEKSGSRMCLREPDRTKGRIREIGCGPLPVSLGLAAPGFFGEFVSKQLFLIAGGESNLRKTTKGWGGCAVPPLAHAGSALSKSSRAYFAFRCMKVTACARTQSSSGLNVVSEVPVVMPSAAAQATALA